MLGANAGTGTITVRKTMALGASRTLDLLSSNRVCISTVAARNAMVSEGASRTLDLLPSNRLCISTVAARNIMVNGGASRTVDLLSSALK